MANNTASSDCNMTTSTQEPKIIINIAMGMVALLSVCGILGNALVIFVFSKQKQKLSSTIFIITLAVTDFVTSLVTMPYTVAMELLSFKIDYDVVCKLYQFMKTTTIPFSALVMVAIALDRYLCIVYPFKHIMTIKRAKVTVFFLCVFAFMLGLICSLMIGTYQRCDAINQHNNESVYYTNNTQSKFDEIIIDKRVNNNSLSDGVSAQPIKYGDIYHDGVCKPTFVILSKPFMKAYQRVYSCLFGVCAVLVTILYALTYRSVLNQRRKRFHLSNKCCGFLFRSVPDDHINDNTECTNLNDVSHSPAMNGTTESTEVEALKYSEKAYRDRTQTNDSNNANDQPAPNNHKQSQTKDSHLRPGGISRAKLKKLRVANIKTALMLSIVAFIYIVAFTPAWMMALDILDMNVIVYYLYFTYNVANPVIYAFLNQNFRTHLQQLFKCSK